MSAVRVSVTQQCKELYWVFECLDATEAASNAIDAERSQPLKISDIWQRNGLRTQ
jgi:hypothetical protein